ncbi:PD-(D/E)XK nuclease family protein [Salinimicrobium sediminilitoris]|uniref:PD-(D/E)XK nuclease family protein n=1 Tax=Salinimicrobium sediminilitoris TaxID=2876715 RepID=UPI001E33485D|nr:PD-(D/E)XK nuclease family protein [Salinimicrobium sediminilitoris]MCC8360268.1 PD-(D/E)XK nuclease family protein [Salinimicrobium sediminilitoris]
MDQNIIPVEAIRERDIDLILLEELATEPTFCRWFVERLELPPLSETDGAWRSISDFGVGETDVLFSYFSGNQKIMVLIENKLDADFQEEQFNRYLQRADEYKNRGACSEGHVVLIAPKNYCENQNDFNSYITYEEISQRLESTSSQRGIFRSQLLKIAIEKMRRGYQPVNSEPVQKFWIDYWSFRKNL